MSLIGPNIHPVLVHFTFALMSMAALCLLIVALAPPKAWRESLGHAADWMIAFGAAAIVLTVAAGFEAYYTVAHDGPSHEAMTTHRNWAVPTALALLGLAGRRWLKRQERPSLLFASVFAVAALSLSVTAWWGGRLVYEHGLGVASLPQVSGEGHDHDHGDSAGDDHAPAVEKEGSAATPPDDHHDDDHDHGDHPH